MTAASSPAGVRVDRRVMRLAALFVQPDGCYTGLEDVDAWPEQRDARRYAGPLPVVAHPPCQLWGAMAAVNYARWGGDHNRPGNDGGCFAAALESVRRFGGVLEHPAKTRAWAAHGLAKPVGIGWQRTIDGGWVCEVWQSAYGHRANKATWLYYHGTNAPFELRWERTEGTHQIGFHDQRGKAANKPTLGKREANATPLEFRDELLRLAMKAHNAGGRSAETHFKPGDKPHTWNPVWHERVSNEGYLQRKVTDTGVTWRDYRPVHHLVWQEAWRDIPPGYALVFRDGDKRNFALCNLELVTRADIMRRNSFHNYGPEIAAAVQLRGAITRQINKRMK